MLRLAIFSSLVLILAACEEYSHRADPIIQSGDPVTMSCPVKDPRNVNIWINAMPGMNDNPTLIAEFTVTAPTPGYSFDLELSTVQESMPPTYIYDLVATPPAEPVIQVETEVEVRIEKPRLDYKELLGLEIMCGGTSLIRLDEVVTAH